MTVLAGLRVLVVEDEGAIALLIEDLLDELGCELAASAARLSQAWDALQSTPFGLAVLDVNLAGETSFEFARALAKRGTPFVFSTGYGSSGLPADLQSHPVLTKPFAPAQLFKAIESALHASK